MISYSYKMVETIYTKWAKTSDWFHKSVKALCFLCENLNIPFLPSRPKGSWIPGRLNNNLDSRTILDIFFEPYGRCLSSPLNTPFKGNLSSTKLSQKDSEGKQQEKLAKNWSNWEKKSELVTSQIPASLIFLLERVLF